MGQWLEARRLMFSKEGGTEGLSGERLQAARRRSHSRQRAAILDHISSEELLFTGSESHPFSLLYIQPVFIEHFLCETCWGCRDDQDVPACVALAFCDP